MEKILHNTRTIIAKLVFEVAVWKQLPFPDGLVEVDIVKLCNSLLEVDLSKGISLTSVKVGTDKKK